MRRFIALLPCALLVLTGLARAADEPEKDAEGCTDSPLIARFPGSVIHGCDRKEFDQFDFPLPDDKDGNAASKHVEGELRTWDVATREGMSELQVYRNFEAALKRAGFVIDYPKSPTEITAHKGGTWFYLDNKGTFYYQTIVTSQEMKQELTVDASSLKSEIDKTGHVAVYGIHFETGKAEVQPDSEETLKQVVALLQGNPELKLRVEGHTDNQGAAAANMALSEKRAQAVVAWLSAHGVAATRLQAQGFGQTKPVADNASEAGRAKNRRVELAKL
jgi:outer membrane protein OmpA-like peptidoglycan-associated protein